METEETTPTSVLNKMMMMFEEKPYRAKAIILYGYDNIHNNYRTVRKEAMELVTRRKASLLC